MIPRPRHTFTNGRYELPAHARGVLAPDHAFPRDPDIVLAGAHTRSNVEATLQTELLACPAPTNGRDEA